MAEGTRVAAKATTEHEAANAAIGTLREAAKVLKDLGDENRLMEHRIASLEEKLEAYERADAEDRVKAEKLDEWRGLLEDFRRGIRDKDELLGGTIGR